jgi:hypothetical protein
MVFRKNRPGHEPENAEHAMRGRDSEPGKRGANALARRFLVDEEPDTIDLQGPAAFHAPADEPEPDTREAAARPAKAAPHGRENVLSRDPETGKFYVHPGNPECPVLLCGEPVTAPTELRKSDRIQVGDSEFEFRGATNTD